MTFLPDLQQGMIDVYMPDGRHEEAQLTVNRRAGRQPRESGDKRTASVTIEFFGDSILSYDLPRMISDGDLKALNLDYIVHLTPSSVENNTTVINTPPDTPAGVGG